jgi:hypothetical protein
MTSRLVAVAGLRYPPARRTAACSSLVTRHCPHKPSSIQTLLFSKLPLGRRSGGEAAIKRVLSLAPLGERVSRVAGRVRGCAKSSPRKQEFTTLQCRVSAYETLRLAAVARRKAAAPKAGCALPLLAVVARHSSLATALRSLPAYTCRYSQHSHQGDAAAAKPQSNESFPSPLWGRECPA